MKLKSLKVYSSKVRIQARFLSNEIYDKSYQAISLYVLKNIMGQYMYCINCGAENSNDAVFCDKCGSNINEVKNQPQQSSQKITEPSTTTPPTSNYKAIGYVILAIIVVLVIIIATMGSPSHSTGGTSTGGASTGGALCGPQGYRCVNPSAVCCGGQYCCMQSCCGDNCCTTGSVCSNGQCCPSAYPYYYDGNCHSQPSSAGKCPTNYYYENGYCYISCQAGRHCAGVGDTCCGTNCCKAGYICSAGYHCCSPAYPYYMSDGYCHSSSSTSSSYSYYYWYRY